MATTDTVLGHLQQPSQLCDEPAQNAFSYTEGGARAALFADRAPECLTPEAAEPELLPGSAPLSPLPEAPATTLGLPDMMALLLPPVLHAAGQSVPSQDLFWPGNASGKVRTGSAAADAGQSGAEQQLGELPAHSPPHRPGHGPGPGRQRRLQPPPAAVCMLLCQEMSFALRKNALSALLPTVASCWHPVATCPTASSVQSSCADPRAPGTHAVDKGQVCPLCWEAVLATVHETFY